MITVSATKLRNNLFEYLDKVMAGEMIIVQRNNKEVVRITPLKQPNWREKMTVAPPQILTSFDNLIKPVDDAWDDYL